MKTASDEEFARAFAPLLEVVQRGTMRPARPADVLELLGTGGRRYLLKGRDGRYLAKEGKGWSKKQQDALLIPEAAYAREMSVLGLKEYGVQTRVVRLRRKGTSGIEAVRLRPNLDVRTEGGEIRMFMSNPEAMALVTALTGAKQEDAEQ